MFQVSLLGLSLIVPLVSFIHPTLFSEPWWTSLSFQLSESLSSNSDSTGTSSISKSIRSSSLLLARSLIESSGAQHQDPISNSSPTSSVDSGVIVDPISLFLSPNDILDDGNVLFQSTDWKDEDPVDITSSSSKMISEERDRLTKVTIKSSSLGIRKCLQCNSKSHPHQEDLNGWNWIESSTCICGGSWWTSIR